MALTFNKTERDLSIKGVLTLTNEEQIYLTAADVVSYSGNVATGSEGLPLGTTEAASFSLTLDNKGRRFDPAQLDNAEVHMFVGIKEGDDYNYKDFGVWYVSDSSAPEQSVTITLNGYDALATRFEAEFYDAPSAYPTTVGSLAQAICVAAGIKLRRIDFPNAAAQVPAMPAWEEGTTLRNILSYCAIAAGGFVRIARNGQLDIVSYFEGEEYALAPSMYQTFTSTGGSAFSFNAIEVIMTDSEQDNVRFPVDPDITPNATNTIQVDQNPLMTENLLATVRNELAGTVLEAGDVSWGGDPEVMCGDKYVITDLRGNEHVILVNSQSFEFGGGLRFTDSCILPAINSVNSVAYSTSTNMFDANGKLRATRISGLDQSVVRATAGHFERLTSETIEADKLTVNLLSAIDLMAKNIDAESVNTNILTSTLASIVEATIKKLTAGTITTDELYAAFAEMTKLNVGSLTAADITADTLGGALAKFTKLTAKHADFSLAEIENLLANALILQEGIANSMQIVNLAITSANIMSATLGELVLKGEDGKYYHVFVGSDGTISTEEATVSEDEITAGQTTTGKQIVETTANIADLNAQTIKAQSAIIASIFTDALTAGKITAGQALISSATIPELYTTSVNAIGDSMTFSANTLIQFMLGISNNVNAWFRFTDDAALEIGRDDSAYYTSTDNEGFHVNQRGVGRIGSFAKRTLRTDNLSINNSGLTMKKSSKGGIRFVRSD